MARTPDNVAIIEDTQGVSYEELWDDISSLSAGLSVKGVKKGDKVVVILPNSKEFVLIFFALIKIGAIMVPLQPVYTIREYKEIFQELDHVFIVTTTYLLTKVLGYEESFIHQYRFIISEDDKWVKTKYRSVISIQELIASNAMASMEDAGAFTEVASINFTYRGFGYPLGAMLTHDNYLHSIEKIFSVATFKGEKYLSALPMSHIFSLVCYVLMPLLKGFTVVIIKSHSAWEFLKAIEENRINIIFGVPTFYSYLLKSYDKQKFDISCLNCGISGGSFLSARLHKEIEQGLGTNIFQGYGLTEGLIATANRFDEKRIPSLGKPLPGIEVKVLDEHHQECPVGQKGEIVMKSPTVMKGYYNKPEETLRVLKEGWLYTGDFGKFDDEGYLFFEGLKKRIAKVGGHIVDLQEVEDIITLHPNVHNAEIYSEHDNFWGQSVSAEISTGIKTTEEEMLNFYSNRLAPFKIPKKNKIINRDGAHILVLDDDVETQCLYLYNLNEQGYNVTVVDAAFKAIEEIKSGFYDLLITELQAPDKKGQELLMKIASANPSLPIIIITQQKNLLECVDFDGLNVVDIFIKPIIKEELVVNLKKVVKS